MMSLNNLKRSKNMEGQANCQDESFEQFENLLELEYEDRSIQVQCVKLLIYIISKYIGTLQNV